METETKTSRLQRPRDDFLMRGKAGDGGVAFVRSEDCPLGRFVSSGSEPSSGNTSLESPFTGLKVISNQRSNVGSIQRSKVTSELTSSISPSARRGLNFDLSPGVMLQKSSGASPASRCSSSSSQGGGHVRSYLRNSPHSQSPLSRSPAHRASRQAPKAPAAVVYPEECDTTKEVKTYQDLL